MKKIIAILVVFAMVATVAFAETSISGSVEVRWQIAGNGANDTVVTGGGFSNSSIQFSTSNDEGTYGGTYKMVPQGHWSGTAAYTDRAFAWWQPIPQIKFYLGQDGDGMFNTANLIRWGHHRMDRGIAVEDWDAQNYLLGNWDSFGMALMIYPIEGLAINFAMNLGANAEIGSVFENRIQVQVSYSLDGVGNFFVTYKSMDDDAIGLTYQSAGFVDGLSFEVGGNYNLTREVIYAALGVHYNADMWGIRSRFQMRPNDTYFIFKADIMPFINFDFGTLFINFRVANVHHASGSEVLNGSDKIGFHINPYLRMPMGGHDFRVGVMVEDRNGSGTINWRVPVSMLVNF